MRYRPNAVLHVLLTGCSRLAIALRWSKPGHTVNGDVSLTMYRGPSITHLGNQCASRVLRHAV